MDSAQNTQKEKPHCLLYRNFLPYLHSQKLDTPSGVCSGYKTYCQVSAFWVEESIQQSTASPEKPLEQSLRRAARRAQRRGYQAHTANLDEREKQKPWESSSDKRIYAQNLYSHHPHPCHHDLGQVCRL